MSDAIESRLTAQDRLVLQKLCEAWNEFMKLPKLHPEEIHEFRYALHVAQAMIQSRPELEIEKQNLCKSKTS